MIKNRGFTILELLATVTIVAILGAVAIPAFNNTIKNSRLTSATNAVVGAFHVARSEAINTRNSMSVEFLPAGGLQIRNTVTNAIIRTYPTSSEEVTISAADGAIVYRANGYREFGSNTSTVDVCNSLGNCRVITIASGGGVTVSSGGTVTVK